MEAFGAVLAVGQYSTAHPVGASQQPAAAAPVAEAVMAAPGLEAGSSQAELASMGGDMGNPGAADEREAARCATSSSCSKKEA